LNDVIIPARSAATTGTGASSATEDAAADADRDRAFAHLAESAKDRDFVRDALRHAEADGVEP
jgi:hypothetical protein